ncbi:MAG: hypothetical protein GWN99_07845 [Gemmatimonadetes bacterium]|uniref:Mth938 domain-containing protein n=1 Tax=Candidatus Kutchimonas denitrificans TaxID=3056748 RepID=A0AAE4ZCM7_9BACT|nr:hypothetical protein [Gemmatimonadota bacterium]NIR75340.1 hypothetical protein [Candidatus Kutchimonas denitrificans]NIS00972.1 hypothetical protein [Gemmatimonadota bacterium]NIT66599.1 hypothetical protein [Gemmatimonadota bacterium]NIU53169.1 hypothetical protein [Gemmatimonadota bacterium]
MDARKRPSPRVVGLSWGRIEVDGREAPYKDAKLFPGGSREWDWNETGTRHQPGIQPADVEELVEHGARVVVFGCGMYERLGVCPETLEQLEERGVEVRIHQSEEAVRVYNELAEKEAVGALVHSTC